MTTTAGFEPADYPRCGHADRTGGGAGCRGRRVPPTGGAHPYGACPAHLDEAERRSYLASLSPGSALDLRGVTIGADLLARLLRALTPAGAGPARVGRARFEGATFEEAADFGRVLFTGPAEFDGATFNGGARFDGATFEAEVRFGRSRFRGGAKFARAAFRRRAGFGGASFAGCADFSEMTAAGAAVFREAVFSDAAVFQGAQFAKVADFSEAEFGDAAVFRQARFSGDALFPMVRCRGRAVFRRATFSGDVHLHKMTCQGDVVFRRAAFDDCRWLGPLQSGGTVSFTAARFSAAVAMEVTARKVDCTRTHWASTAVLRLRKAAVDLTDAVCEYPVSITGRPQPRPDADGNAGHPASGDRVRMVSLRGVDASHVVLTDVDVGECRFAGAIRLDQLRLHGRCLLKGTPRGVRRHGLRPVRWTARQTLAEEQHWRAARSRTGAGWAGDPEGRAPLEPAVLAPVYRELRKGFEDAKNEPGAADFYYGEMEMRRHNRHAPGAERALLRLYWAVSGYGLRASRALGWLVAAMPVTVLLMMLWGLPESSVQTESTGTVDGRRITMTTDTPSPVNPRGTLPERLTGERFELGTRVVINSVVFRSSGKELTTFGTYTEMVTRFAEPTLLALALLALRNRVKR